MKRGKKVLIAQAIFGIFIVILSLSLISSETLDDCEGGVDSQGKEINGVFIAGTCYDCGQDDGVCPEDFLGADCSNHPDPDCPSVSRKYFANGTSGAKIYSTEDNRVGIQEDETLRLIFYNTGLSSGTDITFEIKEKDTGIFGISSNDDIKDIETTVDSEGHASVIWNVSQADLEKADESDQDYEFYFETSGDGESEFLYADSGDEDFCVKNNITTYLDYETEYNCEEDRCTLCSGMDNCGCSFINGTCELTCDENNPWGRCIFSNTGEDDCSEDGVLSYQGTWVWQNITSPVTQEEENALAKQESDCYSRSIPNPIPCQGYAELGFFTVYSFIGAIALIVLVYVVWSRKRKPVKKKK